MKNSIISIAIGLLLITGCTGVKSLTKGLENESFIELIGNPKSYPKGVIVIIDETLTFNGEVNKVGIKRPKSKLYSISTGKHIVTVKHNNEIIYSKQIFVSAQETKQIFLP